MRIEETDNRIIVYLYASDLPESQVDSIGGGFLNACSRARLTRKKLVIDFRGIQVLTSAVIGKLVLLNKAAATHEVELRLANVSRNVLELFRITRLTKVLKFDDDDDDFEFMGGLVPRPTNPDSDNEHAE